MAGLRRRPSWRTCCSSRELDRRARQAGVDLVSVGAHPGYARTNLVAAGPATGRRLTGGVLRLGTALVGQSARAGALPQLRAATDPEVQGGEYFGPRGPAEQRGLPKRVRCSANARDDRAAGLLWAESERLTGVDLRRPRRCRAPEPEVRGRLPCSDHRPLTIRTSAPGGPGGWVGSKISPAGPPTVRGQRPVGAASVASVRQESHSAA